MHVSGRIYTCRESPSLCTVYVYTVLCMNLHGQWHTWPYFNMHVNFCYHISVWWLLAMCGHDYAPHQYALPRQLLHV